MILCVADLDRARPWQSKFNRKEGPMKTTGPVTSLLIVAATVAQFGAGCSKSAAIAAPPSAPSSPTGPASDAGAVKAPSADFAPAIPEVVKNDPFQKRLMKRLKAYPALGMPLLNPAGAALAKTLAKPLPGGIILQDHVTCYGEKGNGFSEKREKRLRQRFAEAGEAQRKQILSEWPVEGCAVDVRYPSASAVLALDETTFRNRESPFNGWKGTNGRTVPRTEKEKGKETIVATWFFLQPPRPKPYGGIAPKEICELYKDCQ
jgi:hypothetical protein